MTETTLKVDHEMILPEDLKYTKYQTSTVKNLIELQTLEKGYNKYPASSMDSTSITWNLPSISGGSMIRELEVEIPLTHYITYRGVHPALSVFPAEPGGFPIVDQADVVTIQTGSSPRPFMNEINCLDLFPLSKLFGSREYTINNSSTILKEEFRPEQIDAMVAQMDLQKVMNMGVCPFADANAHFEPLCYSSGGQLQPLFSATFDPTIEETSFTDVFGGPGAVALQLALNAPNRSAEGIASIGEHKWYGERNTARNIQAWSITLTDIPAGSPGSLQLTISPGCGFNVVPTILTSGSRAVYYVGSTESMTYVFNIVVREQLVSQYWDHQCNYNEHSWNKIIPISSLNVKFNINTQYLQQSLLKIGDNVAGAENEGGAYSVPVPTITSQANSFLIVRQQKIPLAVLPRESYKVLYYDQTRPQASKELQRNGVNTTRIFSAEMTYSNLAQVPEYLMIYLPIDKTSFISSSYQIRSLSNAYQLPSTFNLPITQLTLTMNSDTGLASYGLDMFQLQQFTMENLQNDEKLRDLIVGKSSIRSGAVDSKFTITNQSGASLTNGEQANSYVNKVAWNSAGSPYNGTKGNGVSNSSFYILKLGTQLRMPEGYCPSMIVNYNLTVRAECDVNSSVLRPNSDKYFDLQVFKDMSTSEFNACRASLEVVHFNKRIFTLSGEALQNIYVHNVQITSAEFGAVRNQFTANFDKMERDSVYDTRMMIGGTFLTKLRDKASQAFNFLKPKVDSALKTGREAVDFAKRAVKDDSSLRKYVDMADAGLGMAGYGRGEDPHTVSAGAKLPRRKPASKKESVDWRKYLDQM